MSLPRAAARSTARPLAGVLAGLFVLLAASAGRSDDRWQSPLGHGHPLTGRIWDVAAAGFIAPSTLVERLARAHFVLLGERHDNADHHRLQAELLQGLVARGRRPAVGFEMLTTEQAGLIARQLAEAPRDADALGEAVGWRGSGWPPWAMYRPLVQTALDAGLPIVAANLSPALVRALREGGPTALPAGAAARLGLEAPWPPALLADLVAEITRAHCGHASAAMLERMSSIQRARDAQMAASLVEADGGDGAVLIAGRGHVRTDRGVPLPLRALRPSATIASVALMEVSDDGAAAESYGITAERGRALYDYVWFTARVDAMDPCDRFRRPGDRGNR